MSVSFPPFSEIEGVLGGEVVEVELVELKAFETVMVGPFAGTVTIFKRASVAGSKVTYGVFVSNWPCSSLSDPAEFFVSE